MELNDLVNLEVSDGSDEGQSLCSLTLLSIAHLSHAICTCLLPDMQSSGLANLNGQYDFISGNFAGFATIPVHRVCPGVHLSDCKLNWNKSLH